MEPAIHSELERKSAERPRRRAAVAAAGLFPALLLPVVAIRSTRSEPGVEDRPRSSSTATVNDNPDARQAIEKGLRWLGDRQNANGSFGRAFGQADVTVATTSLCGLSFLAGGHIPGRGPYGPRVRDAARYLLTCQKQSEQGYITEPGFYGGSRMHGNGYAVLFLAELLGMSHDSKDGPAIEGLAEGLHKAVRVIERYQTPAGGWNNEPTMERDEGSVHPTQIQALRAARNAGIKVNRCTIDNAVRYLRHLSLPYGGIRYSSTSDRTTYALTAAGVSSLCFLGEYDLPEVRQGIRFMANILEEEEHRGWRRRPGGHYWFETFYGVQALYQAGGSAWQRHWPRLRAEILRRQDPDGSWDDAYCAEMGTAFALLSLQVPNQVLPIFQR